MKRFVLLCCLAMAAAKPMAKEDGPVDSVISALRDCMEVDTMLCLKERVMKYSENLATAKELNVVDGVSLTRTGSPRSARSYEPLSDDPKARELQVEDRILDNVADFLDNHAIQLRMPKSLDDENSLTEEGRGKKKKKLKKLLPLLALLKLKLAALIPLFLGIIAFAVFKAYMLGKIAFIASAFGTLKKLLESKSKGSSATYEIVAHDEHHGGGGGGGGWEQGGGWGRSQDAQSLAYGAHMKQA